MMFQLTALLPTVLIRTFLLEVEPFAISCAGTSAGVVNKHVAPKARKSFPRFIILYLYQTRQRYFGTCRLHPNPLVC